MTLTSDDYEKRKKQLGYKGCRNCKNQIEPLRMCEWAEQGGDGKIHLFCPRWDKKENEEKKMKIVIDIPEEDYIRICDEPCTKLGIAVQNGTPLPKNHGRLIDADVLKTSFPCGESVRTECVRATIDYASPIIEAEREEEK